MPWKIEVSSDSLQVFLDLKKFGHSEIIDYDSVVAVLGEHNISVTDQFTRQIRKCLDNLMTAEKIPPKPILIQGKPPVAGEKGYFEWNQEFDPVKRRAAFEAAAKEDDQSSHYDRCSIIIVNKGDVLGVMHLATKGRDGQDIFGNTITAEPGADVTVEAGENVEIKSDGLTYIAQCNGVPKLEGTKLWVNPTVVIESDVDFETGNINYQGDVSVRGDIKDLFEVVAKGNINVEGTIEAALIKCGGSLVVQRGLSGKEKGTVEVGGKLSAKYLSNVSVWSHGDVEIDSEIVNTDLNSQGKVVLQKGAIHGGQLVAAGTVETPVIGSQSGVQTIVKAAVDPFLNKQITELEQEKTQLVQFIKKLMPQARELLQCCNKKPDDKLKKMADEMKQSKERISLIDEELEKLNKEMKANCNGTIIVHKKIYPGTILYIGGIVEILSEEITGPLEVRVKDLENGETILSFYSPADAAAPTA